MSFVVDSASVVVNIHFAVTSYDRSRVKKKSIIEGTGLAYRKDRIVFIFLPRAERLEFVGILTVEANLVTIVRDVTTASEIQPSIPVR